MTTKIYEIYDFCAGGIMLPANEEENQLEELGQILEINPFTDIITADFYDGLREIHMNDTVIWKK